MILAFTGTQRGMSIRQLRVLKELLESFRPDRVRHGGCIGADEEFHSLCLGLPSLRYMDVWPSNIEGKVATLSDSPFVHIVRHEPKPPLIRNRDIVAGADHLIACPLEATEKLRSGTWATIRLSSRYKVPCTTIHPL